MNGFQPVYSNRIFIRDGVGVLEITHPAGYVGEHLFDVAIIDKVRRAGNWSESYPRAYAVARYEGKLWALHWMYFTPEQRAGKHVDHINHDSRDSRSENLRLGSSRDNSHNRVDQSIYGPNINRDRNKRTKEFTTYRVNVRYKQYMVFSPRCKTLEIALKVRDRYMEIAEAVERKERGIPTKDELRAIAAEIRGMIAA